MEPTVEHPGRQVAYVVAAAAVALPGVVVRIAGIHAPHISGAVLFGLAIVGAAFMLSWAAEVVQLDIAAGLAIALLALIAVLPEYAVDFVFTWKAGQNPDRYAHLALANMTGGNQLLIGVGWPLVVLLGTWRIKKLFGTSHTLDDGSTSDHIHLERSQSVDIAFLAVASLYGVTLPFKTTLWWIDALVLVAIYVAYLIRLGGAPAEEPHLVGPAKVIGELPVARRRAINVIMFVVSAGVILVCAEPFAESLVAVGDEFGINEFLLVKWIAPLASEAPELLVAALFAWRLTPSSSLGALVSSKVNQWTLLVGTLPIVFMLSSKGLGGLPLDVPQRDELLVTAAQSIFAVAVLASRSMSRPEAWVIFTLFVAQLASSGILHEDLAAPGRIAVAVVFLIAAAWVFRADVGIFRRVLHDGFRTSYEDLAKDPA